MQIAERFDLSERIGGGAAADVHRAFDRELERDVVVRILRADFAADDEYVERFEREAEAATGIRHPNVVEVLDHGVVDGRPFLVRELVEGSTLDDLIERGAFPEEEARAMAVQIARGIEAAHARGVLHRDVNAGSVFVTPDGTAKVVDFGMPTVPRHPAPEQVLRELIDERTDVYGLGAVLYQMLTGHIPRGRLVAPRRLAPRVSKRIEKVVLRALESEPTRRFATAAAFAAALAPAPQKIPIAPAVPQPAPAARSRAAAAVVAPVVAPIVVAPRPVAPSPVVEPAVVEPPVVEPAVVATPVVEAAVVASPVVEPAVVEPAVVEPAVVEPVVVEPPMVEPAVIAPPVVVAPPSVAPPVVAAAASAAAASVVAPVARPKLVSPNAPTERIVRPAATPRPRRRSSASPFILLVIPVLLALLVGAFTLGRPAPTTTAVLSATTTPQALTAPTLPVPTSVPPVETTPEPTTQPTPAPTSAPTAEPPPPTPAPTLAPAPPPVVAPPPPAPAPVSASPAATVVRSFYELINQERFDEAAAHWSSRMQANYPPSTNIYGRFDRTRQIVIRDIAPVPQNTGGATVAIDILEVLDSGVTRRWVGTWQMVWDGSRWLMDAPNLRAA